jgi:hypothetical protein
MHNCDWSTAMVPYGADQTIYVVVDRFAQRGPLYQERDIERPDLDTVISELLSGQFQDPVRVVAFNTLEHWSSDVSRDVARELQSRCDGDGSDVPPHLAGFIEMHLPAGQLAHRRA